MKNYLVLFLCSIGWLAQSMAAQQQGRGAPAAIPGQRSRREEQRSNRQEPRRSARLNSTPIGRLRSV